MKFPTIAIAAIAAAFATGTMANQDDMKQETHGAAGGTQGSAMNENHQRDNTANVDANGKTMDQKMENEVQDDWREDAKERRDADVSKPEQR
jgi:hypothetical protein